MTEHLNTELLAKRAYAVFQETATYTGSAHGLPVVYIPAPWHMCHPAICHGWIIATAFIQQQTLFHKDQ